MLKFNGCPQKHLAGAEIGKWLSLYRWLNRWHTTPMMMGVPIERVDPRFFEAMEIISHTLAKKAPDDGG